MMVKAGGGLTCIHGTVIEVILLFGLSDGHPKSSISSCCPSA